MKIRRLDEAHYGGAFDILDDEFFTRDDINEFGEYVVDSLNEGDNHYQLSEIYLTDGLLEITIEDEDCEFNTSVKIDMRKIRTPKDIKKYASVILHNLTAQINAYNDDINEDMDLTNAEDKSITDIEKMVNEIQKNYPKAEVVIDGDNNSFKVSLNESIDTAALEGPEEGPDAGLSTLVNQAIQDELKTIDMYNSVAINARAESKDDIAKVIDEINTEENKHVGQLQELLKLLSPNADAINAGQKEAEAQLTTTDIK